MAGADHALNGRANEDIAQQLLAVCTHHDEISRLRRGSPYDGVEGVALHDYRVAPHVTQL
jgi:hypothetical protein